MSIPESMREHRLELPEDPVTSLNLVAMAADAWGGLWQAEGRHQGRLGLPVMAGLRRGWVAGQLTVEPAGEGSHSKTRQGSSISGVISRPCSVPQSSSSTTMSWATSTSRRVR